MKNNVKKNNNIVITILVGIIIGLITYIALDKINSNKEENPTNNINKRLYLVNSDLHQQRYYLLLDDAKYDINQNFLNKKTYILDTDMTDNKEIIKEFDLKAVFKPFADKYINENKENNMSSCTVEYFNAFNSNAELPDINYEKEVAFKAYYRCITSNKEVSLGSIIYAYNVETNSIRELGAND